MNTLRVLLPLLAGLAACTPVTLKTTTLTTNTIATGTSGTAGSVGYCLSVGDIPPVPFKPGAGQVMVGLDDFFAPGSDPFPCDDLRASNFRAGVRFDLSQFDKLGLATLKFDTAGSLSRANGVTIGTSPGQSVATTLGIGVAPFSSGMPDTNEASLPAGSSISVAVGGQVQDWVENGVPNNGFVIWGPRGPVNASNPPKDNNAQISFYQNFRLEVTYNPALNPRAPQ